jgi:hypothetical protein
MQQEKMAVNSQHSELLMCELLKFLPLGADGAVGFFCLLASFYQRKATLADRIC